MRLGELEIDILNSFWKLSDSMGDTDISIQDVVDDLKANGIDRAYTTIKTIMDRLASKKSILVRYKSGKRYYYKAVMSKKEISLNVIDKIVKQYFNGSYSEITELM